MAEDSKTDGGAPPSRGFLRGHDPIGVAALLLSVFLALVSGFYVLRNAEIVVQPPTEMLFFRDGAMAETEGAPDPAVLFAAARMPMVNTAEEQYGDLLHSASLALGSGARFPMQVLIEPTFRADADRLECPIEVRCVALQGLFIRQFFDLAYDVPGGSANARMAAFPLAAPYCEGPAEACAPFDTYRGAIAELAQQAETITIELAFVRDGDRTVRCAFRPDSAFGDAILDYGWTGHDCEDASVVGDPLL